MWLDQVILRTDIWRRFAECNVLHGCGSSIIVKKLLLTLVMALTRQTNSRLTNVPASDELMQKFVVTAQRYYFALQPT